MNYLEYVQTIHALGVAITKANCEIEITKPFSTKTDLLKVNSIAVKGEGYRWEDEAEQDVIRWAIDFDKWQHSWHKEIKPENYEHFLEIIQDKVIEKSAALVKLNTIAMFLQNRIAELNDKHISTTPDIVADDCEPF